MAKKMEIAGVTVMVDAPATMQMALDNALIAAGAMHAAFDRDGKVGPTSPERIEFKRLVADVAGLTGFAVKEDRIFRWIAEAA